jgi:hypothetical protein
MAFREGRERDLTSRFGSQRISGIQLDFGGIVFFVGSDRSAYIKFANLYKLKGGETIPIFRDDRANLEVTDLLMQEIKGFELTSEGLIMSLGNDVDLCCRTNDNIEAVVSSDGHFLVFY